jgi:prolyl oligopeptidase
MRSTAGAPRGRVTALSLDDPAIDKAVTVVPEPASAVIADLAAGPEALYTERREGFQVRVRRHGPGDPPEGIDVAPSIVGSTFIVPDPAHAQREPWVETSQWTEPSRILQVVADGALRDTGLRQLRVPAGAPAVQVSEVRVPSHDGAEVPLAILHRKDLPLDGRNPTLLVGYGAYGHSMEAWFDPQSLAWIERGGVIALANVRGSGAFGDAWHRAGFKATKPNTWLDGIACARWLIAKGYASPATLGIWGRSAGGIFVGRAVTAAPELFAAAIFDVGVLDAVRAEESANGITTISEFGSSRNPSEFPFVFGMSTYHHVRDGTPYPAVMLVHGLQDPRVDYWHSAKTAARLQEASTSGRPVLLRLDGQAGHGVGSTAEQAQSLRADIYAFLLWQFGRLRAAPGGSP